MSDFAAGRVYHFRAVYTVLGSRLIPEQNGKNSNNSVACLQISSFSNLACKSFDTASYNKRAVESHSLRQCSYLISITYTFLQGALGGNKPAGAPNSVGFAKTERTILLCAWRF